MVAAPALTPVTRPLADTVATAVLPLDQVTVRPVSGLPFASFGVAASCTVCPTDTLADVGLTATDATGTLDTVTAAVPLFPSLAAVIVAAPGLTPVTIPLADTVATPLLPLDQVTVRPVSGLPLASFGVAASCTVCPTDTLAEAGLTLTDATAARGRGVGLAARQVLADHLEVARVRACLVVSVVLASTGRRIDDRSAGDAPADGDQHGVAGRGHAEGYEVGGLVLL